MQGYPPLHRVVGVELGVLANPMELVGNAWYSPCMLGTLLVGAFRSPSRRSSLPCRTFGLGLFDVGQVRRCSPNLEVRDRPPADGAAPARGRQEIGELADDLRCDSVLAFVHYSGGARVCTRRGGGLQY